MPELDRIDRRILDILQREGRIFMMELGERIGLSTSPCAERVRRMERHGVITGYHVRVDPKALGRPSLVFVESTLSAESGAWSPAWRPRWTNALSPRTWD
jgi:Lrp/AsnC family leucine-responsive transcriptional regulator